MKLNSVQVLANYIANQGPIPTARVSSARSGAPYSYWGAVRYEIRLDRRGYPSNVAKECARSDRRSQSLATQDCVDLCNAENRIHLQRIGRLNLKTADYILRELRFSAETDQPIYTDCENCGTCDHRGYTCPCECHTRGLTGWELY